jgi:hypothetical protein
MAWIVHLVGYSLFSLSLSLSLFQHKNTYIQDIHRHIHTYTDALSHIPLYIHIPVHTYIHTHMNTHIHIHTRTYTTPHAATQFLRLTQQRLRSISRLCVAGSASHRKSSADREQIQLLVIDEASQLGVTEASIALQTVDR